jgi:hypothetical protein
MIVRFLVECAACGEAFRLRTGIGYTELQKYALPCPSCGALLEGILITNQEKVTYELRSSDWKIIDDPKRAFSSMKEITVHHEIPVHSSLQSVAGGSPFVMMMNFVENPMEISRAAAVASRRAEFFPRIRRLSAFVARQDWKALDDAIRREVRESGLPPGVHGVEKFAILLTHALDPAIDHEQTQRAVNEFHVVRDALAKKPKDYAVLLREMVSNDLVRETTKALSTTVGVLDKSDALVPGILFHALRPEFKATPQDFRLYRGDFQELKSLMIDIFEVSSRFLADLGAMSNQQIRGKMDLWLDGETRSLKKTFKLRAFDREFILAEWIATNALYSEVDRGTRNDLGHYKLRYDFAAGELVDEDGHRQNYFLFLKDFLAAARLSEHLSFMSSTLVNDAAKRGLL